MLPPLPKRCGLYLVKDSINNLQIKIRFRSINTLINLPKYKWPTYANKPPLEAPDTTENSSPEDESIGLIKWQQKIFSPTECELYGDLKNCTSEQQKKYHEMLKEEERERKQTKKKRHRRLAKSEKGQFIYTYVHEDNFQDPNELEKTTEEGVKHMPGDCFEQMFVYAALKPEVQLLVLRYFKRQRLLYIYPDFADYQHQPYFVEVDSDYRHLYCYGIEDASLKALCSAPAQEHFLYLPELPTHWRFEDELGKKFHMPPRNTQRCAIMLSINNVQGFEYENVHVRYCIKLPANTILEEGLLEATSHSVSSSKHYAAANIGWTWQLTVLCEEQFDPAHHLRIFFEVISIDGWERERLEGFCHFSMNILKPGQSTIELNCVRPVETVLESINRYFIGGRRKFDFISFIGKQSDEGESREGAEHFYCRYGERMQNTGQLHFSYQILTQRSCELLNPCASRTSGMTLDDIMRAYKEARRRLEAVA